MANGYVSLSEFKAFMRITDATDDVLGQLSIDAAVAAIDLALGLTNEPALFVTGSAGSDTINRVAHGLTAGAGVQFTKLVGGTGLATDTQYYVGGTITVDTFQLVDALGAVVLFSTNITEGWLLQRASLYPVPSVIKLAAQLQGERWFKRRDAPFGVMGSAEFGNFTRLLPKLDPDVELMLGGYGERNRYGTTV